MLHVAFQIATFPFKNNFRVAQPLKGRTIYFLSEKDRFLYRTENPATATCPAAVAALGTLTLILTQLV